MKRLDNPFPLFLDGVGALLDAGYIYIGEAGADPETSPITVYWDNGLTMPAAQPLRTRGAMVVNGASPAFVWIDAEDYSIRIRDADGNQVAYTPNASETAIAYQPLDDDLTEISGQANTAFGLALLTVANGAALKAAAGIVDGIPSTGGTVTGNIVRSGSGPHLFHSDATFVSGKVITTANGAADPTTAIGDIWIELE